MKLLTTSLAFLFASHLFGATFYIDYVAGSNSNDGRSQSTSWKHMPGMSGVTGNAAAYSVQSGDIFVLKGGVTWTFTSTTNDLLTVPASGITIRGGQQLGTPWGAGNPVLDGTGSTGTRACIYSMNKSSVTLDGIKLYGTSFTDGSGSGVSIFYGTGGWDVKNCFFDFCGVNALAFSPASGSTFLFHSNTVQNCGRVHVAVDDNVTFDNVQIYNNLMLGPGLWAANAYHSDGFMVGANCTANPSTFTNILIYGNKFAGDWAQGATALIYLNNSSGPAGNSRSGGYHAKIYNNQLCIDSHGVLSPGIIDISCGWKDIQIYNNTLNAMATGGNAIPAAINCNYLNSDADVVMKNNIISGCDHGIIATDLAAGAGLTVDYNLYQTNGNDHFIWDKNNRFNTLGEIQAQGYETHGCTTTDPKFVTLPNGTTGHGTWALQAGSLAIGAGVSLNSIFTTDVLGNTRGPVWDIGAYQHQTTSAVPPTNATTGISVR